MTNAQLKQKASSLLGNMPVNRIKKVFVNDNGDVSVKHTNGLYNIPQDYWLGIKVWK